MTTQVLGITRRLVALALAIAAGGLSAAPVVAIPREASLVALPDGRMVAPDIARVLLRGELVVAMHSVDTPPFFHSEAGQLVGSDVDLMRALGKELGVQVRFDRSPTTFNGVAELVAKGGADVGISKMARTLARSQSVRFSDTYLKLNHAFLIHRVNFARVARDQPLAQAVRDFRGTLGVVEGSSWVEFSRIHFPNAKVVRYPTWAATVEAVKRGDVTAIYRDDFEIRSVMKSDPSLALTLRTVTFDDLHSALAIAVGIRDAVLLAFINEFIAQQPRGK